MHITSAGACRTPLSHRAETRQGLMVDGYDFQRRRQQLGAVDHHKGRRLNVRAKTFACRARQTQLAFIYLQRRAVFRIKALVRQHVWRKARTHTE